MPGIINAASLKCFTSFYPLAILHLNAICRNIVQESTIVTFGRRVSFDLKDVYGVIDNFIEITDRCSQSNCPAGTPPRIANAIYVRGGRSNTPRTKDTSIARVQNTRSRCSFRSKSQYSNRPIRLRAFSGELLWYPADPRGDCAEPQPRTAATEVGL